MTYREGFNRPYLIQVFKADTNGLEIPFFPFEFTNICPHSYQIIEYLPKLPRICPVTEYLPKFSHECQTY